MQFISFNFLYFVAAVFILYNITPDRLRWLVLLGAGYYFYGSINSQYLLFLIIPTIIVYVAGIGLEKKRKNGLILFAGILVPLGLLFTFKYLDLFFTTFATVFSNEGIKPLDLIFPVGISFYSFRLISYIADVYREKIVSEKHIGHFALYVSFFPQLLAGPIDRAGNIIPQIKNRFSFDWEKFTGGLRLILWGLFKKIVIADRMAEFVERAYGNPADYSGIHLLLGVYFFSFQIYCDFSGYTDIAIGISKIFGFKSIENFNFPYFSRNLKDFWNRWHISLSTWLRDYIFLPVAYPVMRLFKKDKFGGVNITSIGYVTAIFVTMFLGGLWHGASWTFVIWGTLHGLYLVFGHMTGKLRKKFRKKIGMKKVPVLRNFLQIFISFNLVSFAWIFFRADSFEKAITYIKNIGFELPDTGVPNLLYTSFFLLIFILADYIYKNIGKYTWIAEIPSEIKMAGYALFIVLIIIFSVDSSNEFIYFKF
ncbi:MAG: MBOAT family protein [Candidatus Aminicenantes bacterium]|nr:MBOAT family protein [Candidatus Aminicenantes bacterium]